MSKPEKADQTTADRAAVRGQPAPNGTPDAQPGVQLISNATAVLALLSAVFLLLGVAYNFGVFLPLGEGMLMYLSLGDHIQTSIYVSLLILMSSLLLLLSSVFVGIAVAVGAAILFAVLHMHELSKALKNDPGQNEGWRERWQRAAGAGRARYRAVAAKLESWGDKAQPILVHFLVIVLSVLLWILIMWLIPDAIQSRFQGSFILIGFLLVGSAAALAHSLYAIGGIESAWQRRTIRHAAGGVLLLILSFQLGMLESVRAYRYLASDFDSLDRINDEVSVHIIRAFEKGVFVAKHASRPTDKGEIRFLPWREINSTSMAVAIPKEAINQVQQSEPHTGEVPR